MEKAERLKRFIYWLEDELEGAGDGLSIQETNRIRDRVKRVAALIRNEKQENDNPYSDTRC